MGSGNWTQQATVPTHCHKGHALTTENVYVYKDTYRACRTCRLARCRARRTANPEGVRAEWKRWTVENPRKYKKHVLRLYGILPEEFDRKLVAQTGLCSICRDKAAREVDHNHETKQVRDLLCHRCNLLVGFMEKHAGLTDQVRAYLKWWNG